MQQYTRKHLESIAEELPREKAEPLFALIESYYTVCARLRTARENERRLQARIEDLAAI